MAETINTDCPTCGKSFNVPVQYAGKTIRCKECDNTFKVPAAKPPRAAKVAKPAKPVDEEADLIPFKEEESPPKPKASRYDDDEDEENDNPYGLITAGEDIPRCPFCAAELDPPDTKVCLSCGYDMLQRRRRETLAVYEITPMNYFVHWLPAIACIFVIIVVVAVDVLAFMNMRDWLTGSLMDMEEKDELTDKQKFYLPPYCFNLWVGIFSAFIIFMCARFAIRRLILNWKPAEVRKAMERD